jgi:hypothetical protein
MYRCRFLLEVGSDIDPENIPHRDNSCPFIPDVLPVVTQTTASGKSNFFISTKRQQKRELRKTRGGNDEVQP